MAPIRGALGFYDVATVLVTGIGDALADSLGGLPDRGGVVPGEIVWDECDCGLLAVSPRRWFLSDEFPTSLTSGTRSTPCDLPWLVGELAIQVIRCAPSPVGDALAPTVEALDDAARVLVSDAYVTLSTTAALLCELRLDDRIVDYALGEQSTRGPGGGCVGTELVVLVALER